MLVRRAIVALGERRALARLPLARRRVTARDAPLERACFDLLLDELDCSADTLVDRPRDLRLHGDREVAADVLEERAVRLREVVRIGCEPLHRPFACGEHFAAVFELRRRIYIRVDQILDRAIDRSRVLVHAVLNLKDPLVHARGRCRRHHAKKRVKRPLDVFASPPEPGPYTLTRDVTSVAFLEYEMSLLA